MAERIFFMDGAKTRPSWVNNSQSWCRASSKIAIKKTDEIFLTSTRTNRSESFPLSPTTSILSPSSSPHISISRLHDEIFGRSFDNSAERLAGGGESFHHWTQSKSVFLIVSGTVPKCRSTASLGRKWKSNCHVAMA